MAELVLSRVGQAAGQAVLPRQLAFIGQTVGRMAGAALDARFLSPPAEGPRLKEFHLTEGREGIGIPIVYGRWRVGAQALWAARFKERRDVDGGKGGPRVAEYSYSLSFAVGLCEGEIARVSRCWANGELFDLSQVTWRLYRGTEDQAPDPLIEAIEGEAPAYRGLAYIVFEDMPVDQFGGRMPQLSFEIVRSAATQAGRMESVVRGVNMIPGSGEFALAADIVKRRIGRGREIAENLHGPEQKSDFEASLDQLEAELPNVTRVNLVVAWFGTDLRCGECAVRPGVEIASKTTTQAWSVAGVTRGGAHLVSAAGGRANFGGTPADESVRQAVAMLKARGFHVTLYPFLMMDVPPGTGLPDPYGGAEQAAFPWRGRITTTTGDKAAQIAAFFAAYRPFILRYAEIVAEVGAGGMLIGSEMAGLTRTQVDGEFPAVDRLCELAADVRAIVGPDVEVSYAADWTEYGAQTIDGDVRFPLDALWAHEAISYVGVDWYPPMADWRDTAEHADALAGGEHSPHYLAANISGGEAFDWYYADEAGRLAQERRPITDGAYGEPWVFRQKDIRSWWGSAHHERIGGLRQSAPTGWTPGMKPVRFLEVGVPAVDKGANQPNVFYDPKSSESALPHFSDGARDDLIQRRAIEAFHAFWYDADNNPISSAYSGRMLPDDGVAVWAWDARPFPAFPARDDVWSDADNWRLGHWLNGRAGAALLSDVVADVCRRVGVDYDTSGLAGVVPGFGVTGAMHARDVLDPVLQGYAVDALERDGKLVFGMRGASRIAIATGRLVEEGMPAISLVREGLEGAGAGVRLGFVDTGADYAPALVTSLGLPSAQIIDVNLPLAMDRGQAQVCVERLAADVDLSRQRAQFSMAADGVTIDVGDVVVLADGAWRIVEAGDGKMISFEAVRAGAVVAPVLKSTSPVVVPAAVVASEPDVMIVDAPPLPGQETDMRPIGFAFAEPWSGAVVFGAGGDVDQLIERGRVNHPCVTGRLIGSMHPHVSGRWQEASVWVSINGGALASASHAAVLNGANKALVQTEVGWELWQFCEAELVDVNTYRLSKLLRGQQGTEPAMAVGAPAGASLVFLTGAETRLEVSAWERGLELQWRAGGWSDSYTHEEVAGRQWSPERLTVSWSGGDIALSWIRRARTGGDSWGAGEVPLDVPEAYLVRVSGGESVREWAVASGSALYPTADQVVDFPGGGLAIISVAQLGRYGEPGAWSTVSVAIPAP